MVDLDTRPVAQSVVAEVAPREVGATALRSTARRVASATASVLLGVVAVVLVALAAAALVVPRLIGGVPLTVLSGSMEPVLSPGDLVVVQPIDPEQIRVGDVVTFQPESGDPTLVTHRVIGVQWGSDGVAGFVTRGDANGAEDEPVVADQVMGRVVYSVPLVGHLTSVSWGPTAVAIGAAGLLVYAIGTLVVPDRNRRKESDHAETE